MLNKHLRLFNLPKPSAQQAKEQFVNRMLVIFHEVQNNFGFGEAYEELLQEICFILGYDFSKFTDRTIRGKRTYEELPVVVGRDYHRILQAAIALATICRRRYFDNLLAGYSQKIQEAIEESAVPLGIRWHDGYFYPDPIPEIATELLSENLIWLEKYPHARKDIQSALAHWHAGRLAEVLTSLYRGIENIFQEYTGSRKPLHDNELLQAVLKKLNVSPNWRQFLVKFVEYANDYGRHGRHPGRHDIDPDELESYLFFCLTMIRMISKKP